MARSFVLSLYWGGFAGVMMYALLTHYSIVFAPYARELAYAAVAVVFVMDQFLARAAAATDARQRRERLELEAIEPEDVDFGGEE